MDNDNQMINKEINGQEYINNSDGLSYGAEKPSQKKGILIFGVVVALAVVVLAIVGVIAALSHEEGEEAVEVEVVDDDYDDDFFNAAAPMIEVEVAPSSATILIGGNQYTNGEYEMTPGEYEVSINKDGFEPYNGMVIVSDKHKSYVVACLQPVQGNEEYYENNAEDLAICQRNDELMDVSAWDQNALTDKIFEYTPFHGYDGFYLDPYYDDNGNLIVELTFKDCMQTDGVLEDRAYAWMREQGLDPGRYTFEKEWDCEE